MNAPAAKLPVLIECERGLGRMMPRACAKRWKLGNTEPGKLSAVDRMNASGIRNSPCRSCPHGKARFDAGELDAEPSLLRAGDLGLIAPAAVERQAKQRLVERVQFEPSKAERPPKPQPVAEERRCKVCSKALNGHARAETCGGDCSYEWNRRKALASYYTKRGRPDRVAMALAGGVPSEDPGWKPERPARSAEVRTSAPGPAPTPSVPKGEPIPEPEHVVQRLSASPEPAKQQEPAIIEWAYAVKVRGVPVRCRTLADVVALVDRFGAQL